MNTTHQQYIVAIAECGSLTKAAKRLGISQPALTSWLNGVEQQLGTPLVLRSRKQLALMPAGRLYLEGARRMLEIKQKTYAAMAGTSGYLKETVRLSGTPNGGASVFSDIYAAFLNRYPSVSLEFTEGYNSQCLAMVADGRVDIGLCSTLDTDSELYDYFIMQEKELVLMLPAHYPMAYDASDFAADADFPTIDLLLLGDIPFILPSKEMSYHHGLLQLFEYIGFQPRVIFRSANVKVIYEMVRNGNGASVLPRRYFSPLDKVSPFSFRPKFMSYSTVVVRKGYKLTEPQRYLVELMKRH